MPEMVAYHMKKYLNNRTMISRDMSKDGRIVVYCLETRSGLSTKAITLSQMSGDFGDGTWEGTIIEYGLWRKLTTPEIQQCLDFLKERGYL